MHLGTDGLSLSELILERDELRMDYEAFMSAYDKIRMRIVECQDRTPPRVPLLHQWSGTSAVCGSLELSINAIKRTIEEYDGLIEQIQKREITNTDRPALRLVTEETHG